MTSQLDLAPDLGPLDEGVHEINLVLDRMHAAAASHTGVGLVSDLERIVRRVEALKLTVVARSETAAAAKKSGFTDTGSWLARQTRQTRDAAAREARLADDLGTAPATGHAMATGALSAAHAAVITETLAKLPTWVTPDQRATIEADLVTKAARFDPSQLRRVARRALDTVEPDQSIVDTHENDQIADEEATARAKVRFTFHTNDDGTVTAHVTVPALEFSFLRKILDAMTAPRSHRSRTRSSQHNQHDQHNQDPGSRSSQHDQDPGSPSNRHDHHRDTACDTRTDRGADWAARRGHAFAELLRHLPTDHLHAKTSATVVVHLRHDVLTGALATAGLDTGHSISAGEARRLACTAGLLPAVLGGKSLPLDLGRTQRLFTDTQRIALSMTHTTCATDGCERPFAWCEIHHRQPWSHGGPTNLANAIPLCSFHHHQVHRT